MSAEELFEAWWKNQPYPAENKEQYRNAYVSGWQDRDCLILRLLERQEARAE